MECNNICRLCASPLSRGGVDLFTNGNADYLKKIRIYFGLELLFDSDVPVKMCGNCSFEFENIDSFKERCIQAQKSLETLLNKCHYRILSDDELFKNPKDSESTATNVPAVGNQFMVLSNQSAGSLVDPNYINSNGSLPRTGVNEIHNFQSTQNHNMVMVNNHSQNDTINIPLQSMPINGIGLPQTQFVMLSNQSGVQFQNQNSTSNSHLQTYMVNGNNECQPSLNTSSESNEQLTSSVDSNGQENVTQTTNNTLITPKMEVNIKKESDAEEEDDDDDDDDDDDSCVSGGHDNESSTLKNGHESVPITVELVKKVKKEKLDVCEEMSSVRDEKCDVAIELLESTDELIVGMQMDDLLLKAVKNNEKDKHEIVSADDSSVIKDNDKVIKNTKEIDIFNLNNIKHINKLSYSSTVIAKMIDAKVPVSDIVSACRSKNQEIVKDKNPTSIENVQHNRNSTGTSLGAFKNLDNWFTKKMEERPSHSAYNSVISTSVHNSVIIGNRTTAPNQSVRVSDWQSNQRKEVIPKQALIFHHYVPKAPTIVPNVQSNSVPLVSSNFKGSESKLRDLLQPYLQKTNKPINTMDVYLRTRNKNNTQLKRKVDESDNKVSDPDYKPSKSKKSRKFECPICDRCFNGHSYLMDHMRLHNTQ